MNRATDVATPWRGEFLSWQRCEGWLEVHLHGGPANELGPGALSELEALVRYLNEGADGARGLIVGSDLAAGFGAGADLRALHRGMVERGRDVTRVRAGVKDFVHRIHAVFSALDRAPLVTVAAVHGVVFGGGFELALTCDVIIAERSARFSFPELRLGLIPGFGGLARLERDAGNAALRDLLFTGRSVRASRAKELGWVSQVVGDGERWNVARSVVAQACKFDPKVVRQAKGFAKPQVETRLRQERDTFVDMVVQDTVFEALERFTNDNGIQPYLP